MKGEEILATRFTAEDKIQPWPTSFLGLGSTGCVIVRKIQQRFQKGFPASEIQRFSFLGIDTDPLNKGDDHVLGPASRFLWHNFNGNDYVTGLDPKNRRYQWWPQVKIGGKLKPYLPGQILVGCSNVRCTGRLAFDVNAADVLKALPNVFAQAINIAQTDFTQAPVKYFTVYVVASLCGGTGSGTFMDAAYAARAAVPKPWVPIIAGVLLLPSGIETLPKDEEQKRHYANAYAALRELDHYATELHYPGFVTSGGKIVQADEAPFDVCYVVEGRNAEGYRLDSISALEDLVADILFLQTATPTSSAYHSRVTNIRTYYDRPISGKSRRYSSFGLQVFHYDHEDTVHRLAKAAAARLIDYVIQRLPGIGKIGSELAMTLVHEAQLVEREADELITQIDQDSLQFGAKPAIQYMGARAFRKKGRALVDEVNAYRRRAEVQLSERSRWRYKRQQELVPELQDRISRWVWSNLTAPRYGLVVALEALAELQRLLTTYRDDEMAKEKIENEQKADAALRFLVDPGASKDLSRELEHAVVGLFGRFTMPEQELRKYLEYFRRYLDHKDCCDLRQRAYEVFHQLISFSEDLQRHLETVKSSLEKWRGVGTAAQVTEPQREERTHIRNIVDSDGLQKLQREYVEERMFNEKFVADTLKGAWEAVLSEERRDRDALFGLSGSQVMESLVKHFSSELSGPLDMPLLTVVSKLGDRDHVSLFNELYRRSLSQWMWSSAPVELALEETAASGGQEAFATSTHHTLLYSSRDEIEQLWNERRPKEAEAQHYHFVSLPNNKSLALLQSEHGIPLFAMAFAERAGLAQALAEELHTASASPLYTHKHWPERLPGIWFEEKREERQWFVVGMALKYIRMKEKANYYEMVQLDDHGVVKSTSKQLAQGREKALQAFVSDVNSVEDVKTLFQNDYSKDNAAVAATLHRFRMKLRQLQEQAGPEMRLVYDKEEQLLVDFCTERMIVLPEPEIGRPDQEEPKRASVKKGSKRTTT